MRIASLNIQHGRSLSDGEVDADRLRAAVKALDADVLGLQEVDRNQTRSHQIDQTEVAAEAMGAVDARFMPALIGTPGVGWRPARGVDDPDAPAYGVALVSRIPVKAWVTVRLPALPLRRPRDEPRVAVGATFDEVSVFTTHLSFLAPWNAVQIRRLLHTLQGLPGAQVLTGDLNISGPLPRVLREWKPLISGLTFPANEPRAQLDHVLARRWSPTLAHTEIVELPVGDHLAVVVDVAD